MPLGLLSLSKKIQTVVYQAEGDIEQQKAQRYENKGSNKIASAGGGCMGHGKILASSLSGGHYIERAEACQAWGLAGLTRRTAA
jgi:hypothetical protein